MTGLPNKRPRNDEMDHEEEGAEESKMSVEPWDPAADDEVPMPPPPPSTAIAPMRRSIGAHLRKSAPTSLDYWNERFPGFPEWVNEAFAAKARGQEAYEEFANNIEKPAIHTTVQKEIEPGVVVDVPRVVNWF